MSQETQETRREFLQKLASATGAVVLMPVVSACSGPDEKKDEMPKEQPSSMPKEQVEEEPKEEMAMPEVPTTKPEGWDAISFNKTRGNAGAIPESYHASINGPEGVKGHLGKHLPYVPEVDAKMVPGGMIAIMWGDPDLGYVKHPNAPKTDDNPDGHWYNWIKVRKAVEGEAEELKSEYADWPGGDDMKGEKYAVFGGGKITDNSGKNTIYLAGLPKDVKSGDTIRIYAHCLTHGEYVDFLTLA